MVDVSIIIPIYNQEKYLEDCLESVKNQDLDEYEVILIDDGSTDNSKIICETYVKKNNNFRYFYQQNAGLGAARNKGLFCARGNYVLFLDADDAYEQNSLRRIFTYMVVNALDILYIDEIICDEGMEKKFVSPTFPYLKTLISREEALQFCMQPSHICARVYRKKLFDDINFEDMWYEDMACFPKLICVADKIGYYKVPLYYYRQHSLAITHNDTDIRNLDVTKAWKTALGLKLSLEEERKAVQKAVVKSIADFIFFKPYYADKYIEWYRDNLEGKILDDEQNISSEGKESVHDYPLKQQAMMVGMNSIVTWLEVLENLYENGGEYNLGELSTWDTVVNEVLLLKKRLGVELCGIRVQRRSMVLNQICREVQNQNLIARDTSLKTALLEKIVTQAFMEHGRPVRIVE